MFRPVLPMIALASVVALTACSGGSPTEDAKQVDPELQELYEAARVEGQLTWYSAQNPSFNEALIDAFTGAYPGVDVEYLRLAGGELGVRYQQERDADVVAADILTVADPVFLESGAEEGWFEELAADTIPALATWPEKFVLPTRVTVGIQPAGISYNTDLVSEKDVPADWKDLLDPQYADGKIMLADPSKVPTWLALADLWRETYGDEFLQNLASQDFVLVDSVVPGTQQLAAGEVSLLVPNVGTSIASLEGAPIALVIPEPGIGVEFLSALSDGGDSPNAARLFLDFMLSEEGQAVFNASDGWTPGPDAGEVKSVPESYEPNRIPEALKHRDELLSLLGLQ